MTSIDAHESILARLVDAVAPLEGVAAISLGGSAQAGFADEQSDLDIHVWWRPPLASNEERSAVLAPLADAGSLRVGVQSWGLEDHLAIEGIEIELIFFRLDEIQAGVAYAYDEGLDGESFTTALLYTVAQGRTLHDSTGEFRALQERLNGAFPEATFQKLLERRSPLLHTTVKQIRRAQQRGDWLSVQQRRDTFQAIYFNLLFTLNRRYHPGEKRLLLHAEHCPLRPPSHESRWTESTRMVADDPALPDLFEDLARDLLRLIEQEGVTIRQEAW